MVPFIHVLNLCCFTKQLTMNENINLAQITYVQSYGSEEQIKQKIKAICACFRIVFDIACYYQDNVSVSNQLTHC